jgi:hypothetical protein
MGGAHPFARCPPSSQLVRVLISYPHLGRADTIAHHVAFIITAVVCASQLLMLLPFSWLLLGEFSTLPLNLRWLLITTGRGATPAMDAVNAAFALAFFCTRIVLYGAGLAQLWTSHAALLAAPTDTPPAAAVYAVLALLTMGFGLNGFWFARIVQMARPGAGGRAKKP